MLEALQCPLSSFHLVCAHLKPPTHFTHLLNSCSILIGNHKLAAGTTESGHHSQQEEVSREGFPPLLGLGLAVETDFSLCRQHIRAALGPQCWLGSSLLGAPVTGVQVGLCPVGLQCLRPKKEGWLPGARGLLVVVELACSLPWPCPHRLLGKVTVVVPVCTEYYLVLFQSRKRGFVVFFLTITRVVLIGRAVHVFAAEDARLPEGQEGRRLLPEPGRPDAVLQVSQPAPGLLLGVSVTQHSSKGATVTVLFSACLLGANSILIAKLLSVNMC